MVSVDRVVEVTTDDDVMVLFLELGDEVYQIGNKGGSGMDVVFVLGIERYSLLMPRCVANGVGGLFNDLVYRDDG